MSRASLPRRLVCPTNTNNTTRPHTQKVGHPLEGLSGVLTAVYRPLDARRASGALSSRVLMVPMSSHDCVKKVAEGIWVLNAADGDVRLQRPQTDLKHMLILD